MPRIIEEMPDDITEPPFKHSKNLFVVNSQPMHFFMKPCSQRRKLQGVIKHGGGILDGRDSPGCVRLTPNGRFVGKQDTVSTDFIIKSVLANKQLSFTDFLWTNPVNGGQTVRFDESEECDVVPARKGCKTRKWNKFTRREDDAMLMYMEKHDKVTECSGYVVYKEIEAKKVVTGHTVQSMNNRFRRTILPHLDSYASVSEGFKERLRAAHGIKGKSSKKTAKKDVITSDGADSDTSQDITDTDEDDALGFPRISTSVSKTLSRFGPVTKSNKPTQQPKVPKNKTMATRSILSTMEDAQPSRRITQHSRGKEHPSEVLTNDSSHAEDGNGNVPNITLQRNKSNSSKPESSPTLRKFSKKSNNDAQLESGDVSSNESDVAQHSSNTKTRSLKRAIRSKNDQNFVRLKDVRATKLRSASSASDSQQINNSVGENRLRSSKPNSIKGSEETRRSTGNVHSFRTSETRHSKREIRPRFSVSENSSADATKLDSSESSNGILTSTTKSTPASRLRLRGRIDNLEEPKSIECPTVKREPKSGDNSDSTYSVNSDESIDASDSECSSRQNLRNSARKSDRASGVSLRISQRINKSSPRQSPRISLRKSEELAAKRRNDSKKVKTNGKDQPEASLQLKSPVKVLMKTPAPEPTKTSRRSLRRKVTVLDKAKFADFINIKRQREIINSDSSCSSYSIDNDEGSESTSECSSEQSCKSSGSESGSAPRQSLRVSPKRPKSSPKRSSRSATLNSSQIASQTRNGSETAKTSVSQRPEPRVLLRRTRKKLTTTDSESSTSKKDHLGTSKSSRPVQKDKKRHGNEDNSSIPPSSAKQTKDDFTEDVISGDKPNKKRCGSRAGDDLEDNVKLTRATAPVDFATSTTSRKRYPLRRKKSEEFEAANRKDESQNDSKMQPTVSNGRLDKVPVANEAGGNSDALPILRVSPVPSVTSSGTFDVYRRRPIKRKDPLGFVESPKAKVPKGREGKRLAPTVPTLTLIPLTEERPALKCSDANAGSPSVSRRLVLDRVDSSGTPSTHESPEQTPIISVDDGESEQTLLVAYIPHGESPILPPEELLLTLATEEELIKIRSPSYKPPSMSSLGNIGGPIAPPTREVSKSSNVFGWESCGDQSGLPITVFQRALQSAINSSETGGKPSFGDSVLIIQWLSKVLNVPPAHLLHLIKDAETLGKRK